MLNIPSSSTLAHEPCAQKLKDDLMSPRIYWSHGCMSYHTNGTIIRNSRNLHTYGYVWNLEVMAVYLWSPELCTQHVAKAFALAQQV